MQSYNIYLTFAIGWGEKGTQSSTLLLLPVDIYRALVDFFFELC